MREGAPSVTARRVAAYRLAFERLPAPFGDSDADERLARDVAGSEELVPSELMGRYLRGRTSFFDRAVLGALERGATQMAVIGGGYDGRSLRYAKPGVRWFELDHPQTQADKRRRLGELGIEPSDVEHVALDLNGGGVAAALLGTGWEPDALSLMMCEGVAVYLELDALRMLLEDLRALATVGTRLAMSLSPPAAHCRERRPSDRQPRRHLPRAGLPPRGLGCACRAPRHCIRDRRHRDPRARRRRVPRAATRWPGLDRARVRHRAPRAGCRGGGGASARPRRSRLPGRAPGPS
ncbi:MAG TPA: class I SAM-dependent methyltransferase [Solirubrobacteraceae bacterium]